MEITIREAKTEDAPAIAKINIASWRSTYRGLIADTTLNNMQPEYYLAKWNSILRNLDVSRKFCFVAENETHEIIGYALCGNSEHQEFNFEGELFALYLLKEYQKQGIGKKLFLRSIEEFKRQNIGSFILFVLSSNIDSRKFYESFKPNFTANETITIDNGQYCDICYGWSDIANIPVEQFFISPE